MKSPLTRGVLSLATFCLLVVPVVAPSPVQAASSAAVLKGTWVGPMSGFTSPEFCGGHGLCLGSKKITITKVKGHAAKGTWQYKSGGGWSDPEPLTFVVRAVGNGGESSLVNGVPVRDAVLSPGDQVVIDQHRFQLEAPGLPLRGQMDAAKPAATAHTQTMKAVRVPVARDPAPAAEPAAAEPPQKDPGALWWLIAAATVLAAALTALLVYAPRAGA